MLFEARFREPIAAGTVTLTFRRWKRRQVVAGNRYRTAAGTIEVESVDVVDVTAVSDAEAVLAGYPDGPSLVADLRGELDLPIYRIAFHAVDDPDPRTELANAASLTEADVSAIAARLDRLDRSSTHGPWTYTTLELIAARPGVRAADLAADVGRDRDPFKIDVRKLKNLGLTESLEVGYRLSPRGTAFLATR